MTRAVLPPGTEPSERTVAEGAVPKAIPFTEGTIHKNRVHMSEGRH